MDGSKVELKIVTELKNVVILVAYGNRKVVWVWPLEFETNLR